MEKDAEKQNLGDDVFKKDYKPAKRRFKAQTAKLQNCTITYSRDLSNLDTYLTTERRQTSVVALGLMIFIPVSHVFYFCPLIIFFPYK